MFVSNYNVEDGCFVSSQILTPSHWQILLGFSNNPADLAMIAEAKL